MHSEFNSASVYRLLLGILKIPVKNKIITVNTRIQIAIIIIVSTEREIPFNFSIIFKNNFKKESFCYSDSGIVAFAKHAGNKRLF